MTFQSESPGGNLKAKGSNPTRANVFYLYLIFLSAETYNLKVVSGAKQEIIRYM